MGRKAVAEQEETAEPEPQREEPLAFASGDVLRVRRAEWLAPGWLPKGHIAMLEGRKGCGKSHVASAFAAYITGGPALPGTKKKHAATVIWGAGEESPEVDTRPKLISAGAQIKHVKFLGMDARGNRLRPPRFPEDLPRLKAMIVATNAKLIVLDPLRSYISRLISTNGEAAMGDLLCEMAEIADDTDSCFLLQRHYRKQQGGPVTDQGIGSVAISAVARVILGVEMVDVITGQRVLRVSATNRGKPALPRQFRIEECGKGTCVKWGKEIADEDEDSNFTPMDGGQVLEATSAENLIRRELSKGPQKAADVYKLAEQDRISKSTMWRALKKLGIQPKRKGCGQGSYSIWDMPAKSPPVSPGEK